MISSSRSDLYDLFVTIIIRPTAKSKASNNQLSMQLLPLNWHAGSEAPEAALRPTVPSINGAVNQTIASGARFLPPFTSYLAS